MVCLINPTRYPTKKSLKEAIERGENVAIEDPSIVNPRYFSTDEMKVGENVIVTNHPKRSYFVTIKRQIDGTLKVV